MNKFLKRLSSACKQTIHNQIYWDMEKAKEELNKLMISK